MTSLEQLILDSLSENTALTNKLATYSNKPAIFTDSVPSDTDLRWKNLKSYPRVRFTVDMQPDRKRKSCGQIVIYLEYAKNQSYSDELEVAVKNCLRDLFLIIDRSNPCQVVFRKTKREEARCVFDLYAYPCQTTGDPDPVQALYSFFKERVVQAVCLGIDQPDVRFKPTAQTPAFYFRLSGAETTQETNTVTWMELKAAVHVFVPDRWIALQWLVHMTNQLALAGEVRLADGSPMQVKQASVDCNQDMITEGQAQITLEYGLLKYSGNPGRVQNIHLSVNS